MPPSRAAIELVGAPVDEAELDVGEADAPVAALGLGDADRLADQHLADEDEFATPLDLAVGAHATDRMIDVVDGLAQRAGIAPVRGEIDGGRGF
jgi:hypothetical protein